MPNLQQTLLRGVGVATGLLAAGVLLVACSVLGDETPIRVATTIKGTVLSDDKPIANAMVMVQGTQNKTTTAQDGSFTLHGEGLGGNATVTVTAWSDGHYIGWSALHPQKQTKTKQQAAQPATIQIGLRKIYQTDNPEYAWFKNDLGVSGSVSCAMCHREYDEWTRDPHSKAAVNERFISMYRGTNVAGKKGQLTVMTAMDKAAPPDPNLPNYGPGFRLDNPERAGNCATCHTPMAAQVPTESNCAWFGCHSSNTADRAETIGKNIRGVMPVGLAAGVAEEGISCEFCHKIGSVILDPQTKLPHADMPGILSLKLHRPHGDKQLFFGTLPDVARERDSFLPLQAESQFCATCHFGVFGGVVGNMKITGGTVVYNSYGEWLESVYADPNSGVARTCQSCHMPNKEVTFSAFPAQGGVTRTYAGAYHEHAIRSTKDVEFLKSAVAMTNTLARVDDGVQVAVSLTNVGAGHAVPTDSPLRSLVLWVQAYDADGAAIQQSTGNTLPSWAGDEAGGAGKVFAKVLKDEWTGETPATAFWRATTLVEDTRLFPFLTDNSTYGFPSNTASVKVTVIYRRAFTLLARQKGWDNNDAVMFEQTLTVK